MPKLTPDQIASLSRVGDAMIADGVPKSFVEANKTLAADSEGRFGLMLAYDEDPAPEDREETLWLLAEDLDERLDDIQNPEPLPAFSFADLERSIRNVLAFKGQLKKAILAKCDGFTDQSDELTALRAASVKAGYPAGFLSRWLDCPTKPRQRTLHKVANALGLTESDIAKARAAA